MPRFLSSSWPKAPAILSPLDHRRLSGAALFQPGTERRIEMGLVDRLERHGVMHSGIGEHDVDLAVVAPHAFVQARQIGGNRAVALHADRCVAITAKGQRLLRQAQATGVIRGDSSFDDMLCVVSAIAIAAETDSAPMSRIAHLVALLLGGMCVR